MKEARKLYAKIGVEKTTMEDVSKAAGCTRRTLYAYFESWEDLVLQVYIDDMEKRWNCQQVSMENGVDGLGKLKHWAEAYFAYAQAHPESVHLEMFRDYRGIEPGDLRPEALDRYENVLHPLIAEMVDVFEQGQNDGSIRQSLAALPTLNQFAFSLRTIMNRVLSSGDSPEEFDTTDFVPSFIEVFLRGIARQPEDRS